MCDRIVGHGRMDVGRPSWCRDDARRRSPSAARCAKSSQGRGRGGAAYATPAGVTHATSRRNGTGRMPLRDALGEPAGGLAHGSRQPCPLSVSPGIRGEARGIRAASTPFSHCGDSQPGCWAVPQRPQRHARQRLADAVLVAVGARVARANGRTKLRKRDGGLEGPALRAGSAARVGVDRAGTGVVKYKRMHRWPS